MKRMARTLFIALFLVSAATAVAEKQEGKIPFDVMLEKEAMAPGYTINFQDVSAIEVLKFLTKVGNLNFIYNEADLGFNVTITSEAEASLADVLSAFVQVLRINKLEIIEDGPNLIIHQNPAVKEMATVISDQVNQDLKHIPPIITRVFPIRKSNPETIARILKPMLSREAQVEVSSSTRHLIVTDVVSSIEKISQILLTLDSPVFKYDSYKMTKRSW